MPATIAHDFDLPMDRVAAGARAAIRKLGYRLGEMSVGSSSRTINFDIPDINPSRYTLEIRQIVPAASRVFVTGSVPLVCQKTLDQIQTTLSE
jgi:hypothetical protein